MRSRRIPRNAPFCLGKNQAARGGAAWAVAANWLVGSGPEFNTAGDVHGDGAEGAAVMIDDLAVNVATVESVEMIPDYLFRLLRQHAHRHFPEEYVSCVGEVWNIRSEPCNGIDNRVHSGFDLGFGQGGLEGRMEVNSGAGDSSCHVLSFRVGGCDVRNELKSTPTSKAYNVTVAQTDSYASV